jgi:uncharacterized protein YceH (UPF0502 family)
MFSGASVESTLAHLVEMSFVKQLPRQPGHKEQRWIHLLSGDVAISDEPAERPAPPQAPTRVDQLAADLAALRREFEEFKKRFE